MEARWTRNCEKNQWRLLYGSVEPVKRRFEEKRPHLAKKNAVDVAKFHELDYELIH